MKKLFLLCLLLPAFCSAQDQRIWATYYGGIYAEIARDVEIDNDGNVYIAGVTRSNSGIASLGFQNSFGGGYNDAFLAKFDSSGNRLWATYYGGSDEENFYSISIDSHKNIYITGYTYSDTGIASLGYQNTYGGGRDAFLVKFDSLGNRLWATYYGSSELDWGFCVKTDIYDNVYLSGVTSSDSAIAYNGYQNTFGGNSDAFIVKFDSNGNRLWATYIGGSGDDYGWGVTVDESQAVYATGFGSSPSGIGYNGYQNFSGGSYDAFLVKLDSSGTRLWGTYYGGNAPDAAYTVTTDNKGDVYIAGNTTSTWGIASGGFQNTIGSTDSSDAFLVKFTPEGERLWATYYGGTRNEEGWSLVTDNSNNVYLAGDTYSRNSVAFRGFQNEFDGSEDLFVAKFDSAGYRLCSTYYGSYQTQDSEDGKIAIDQHGNIYLSGGTACSSNIASGGFQNNLSGGYDACLIKFSSCQPVFTINANTYNINCNDSCRVFATVNAAYGIPPYSYLWSNNETDQTISGLCEGNYSVTVTDSNGNIASDIIYVDPTNNFQISISIYNTDLLATLAPNYQWYLNDSLINGATDQTFDPSDHGIYKVSTTFNGCVFFSNPYEYSPFSINEYDLSNQFYIYPNPSNGYLIIKSNFLFRNTEIKVFNYQGQEVIAPIISKEGLEATMYVSHLAAGVYTIYLKNETQIATKKFIKE